MAWCCGSDVVKHRHADAMRFQLSFILLNTRAKMRSGSVCNLWEEVRISKEEMEKVSKTHLHIYIYTTAWSCAFDNVYVIESGSRRPLANAYTSKLHSPCKTRTKKMYLTNLTIKTPSCGKVRNTYLKRYIATPFQSEDQCQWDPRILVDCALKTWNSGGHQ
jgi:hypothetical protein